jgi:glycosyltransferase involved in cell wall biosynthesis
MEVITTPKQRQTELQSAAGTQVRASGDVLPVSVLAECEISDGIFSVPDARHGEMVVILVRLFTEPLGLVKAIAPADGLDSDVLAGVIVRELEPQLQDRFSECGLVWDGKLPLAGFTPPKTPRFLASREHAMREGPWLTAAVCTRGHPDGLAVTLKTLGSQEYTRLRVVVVDNAPDNDHAFQVVNTAGAQYDIDIEYVVESRPGLSWARNRAIEAANTEVIAFIDDDERCDRWWAAELARGFVETPTASAVTGAIVPGELATESQARFEQFCGIGTGRGFVRAIFSPATANLQSPMFPRPPFGAGGNMAFRRDVLNSIGRFDCALGAGTMTQGAEDTAALSTVLLAGGTIVYQPTAFVRHYYRRDYDQLRRQLRGYGRGLTAFYTSVLIRRPGSAIEMVRLGRQMVRERLSHHDRQSQDPGGYFPRDLRRANLIGRIQGPFSYVAARMQARHLRQTGPEK